MQTLMYRMDVIFEKDYFIFIFGHIAQHVGSQFPDPGSNLCLSMGLGHWTVQNMDVIGDINDPEKGSNANNRTVKKLIPALMADFEIAQGLRRLAPVLKNFCWVRCYQISVYPSDKSFTKGRVN